jgi:hypothetical protein
MSTQPPVPEIAGRLPAVWVALGRLGFVGQSFLVATTVAVASLAIAPLALLLSGSGGLAAVAIAATVSLLAAECALVAGKVFRGPAAPMYGLVAGMFVRMSVALAVGVALQRSASADGTMIFYLLAFYGLTLATETVLLVAKIPASQTQTITPRAKVV